MRRSSLRVQVVNCMASEAARRIVELCAHDPPDRAEEPNPKLFTDLEDDRVSSALFKCWQKGLLYAQWDEDHEETAWRLSHFGEEVCERGLLRPYVQAIEGDLEIDATPAAVGVLER